jgi:hypothetical protein
MTSKTLKWWAFGSVSSLIAATWLLRSVFASPPKTAFEYLVFQPVPASIGHIEEGRFRTMDSVFRVLRFDISPPDMQKILSSQGYRPVDGDEQWDYWEKRIRMCTKLQVNFGKGWQAHTVKDPPNGQRFMFYSSNLSQAVFVADAH